MERDAGTNQIEYCCTEPVAPEALPELTVERTLRMFKALGDESRLAIFRLIAAQDGEICACDIVDHFDLRQPTIAHHLKVLRSAGLISVERRGVWAWYGVDAEGLEALQSVTQGLVGAALVPGAR